MKEMNQKEMADYLKVSDLTEVEISEFKNIIQNNKERHKMRETKIEIDFLLSVLEQAERYEKALKDIRNVSTLDEYEGSNPKSLLHACYEIAKGATES